MREKVEPKIVDTAKEKQNLIKEKPISGQPELEEKKEALEINPDKLVKEEITLISKFRGKAGLTVRAFVLLTFLAASEPFQKAMIKGDHIKEPEKTGQVYKQEQLDEKKYERYLSIVQRSPWTAMNVAGDPSLPKYSDLPKAIQEIVQQAVENAAQERPSDVLQEFSVYKKLPNSEAILQRAAENAAQKNPWSALFWASRYKGQPYTEEVIKTAAKKNPAAALEHIGNYEHLLKSSEAKKIIRAAVIDKAVPAKTILLCLNYYKDYLERSQTQKLIETAAKNDTYNAVRLLEYDDNLKKILEKSKDPAIKVILDIYHSDLSHLLQMKISILAQKILSDGISLEEAVEIVVDEQKLFSSLVEIKSQPNHLAKDLIDRVLPDSSLRRVRTINDLHDASDEKRFESVKNASVEELYTLMTYGEEEIFTSSFNGLFDRLLKGMKEDNISGDQLLKKIGYNKFRTFIKLNSEFNRLNEFLATMDKDLQKDLLESFVKGIDKEENKLSQAVVVADAFNIVQDAEILEVFQRTIKKEYERIKKGGDEEARVIYGLLAGMFGKKAAINEAWIKEMSEKYKLSDLVELSSHELFNQDGTNVQQHFFYNDKDGHITFQNFLSQYKNKSGWDIEEKDNYVLIKARKGDKKVEIYANRPDKEYEGPEEIENILKEKNIQTIVIVHRGHSYHLKETIKRIPFIAKIVSLGSCGGYSNIDAVLEKAPKAHIISTKGRGTALVNEPLFKMLNDEILDGKINWPKFWTKAKKRLGDSKDFKNYVPPHKNLGVLFLKAYHNKVIKG